MTRQEFIDNVTSWSELIDFCNEYGCEECSDVYDEYQRDEQIDNELATKADGWRELYQYLNDIPSGYSYYQYNYDYDEWKGLDNDDFYDYKDEVLEWALNNDIFEEEEEDTYEDIDDEYDEDEEELEDEDISLGDLFSACNTDLKGLEENEDMDSLGEVEINMDDILF